MEMAELPSQKSVFFLSQLLHVFVPVCLFFSLILVTGRKKQECRGRKIQYTLLKKGVGGWIGWPNDDGYKSITKIRNFIYINMPTLVCL